MWLDRRMPPAVFLGGVNPRDFAVLRQPKR
jgi:hypothetical protein